MRQLRIVLPLLLTVAMLAACGDDSSSGGLSEREQDFADSFAVSLTKDEDGLKVSDDEATCMGNAIMEELGTGPFDDADLDPKDVEGDEAPGELLGDGVVSEDQADAILESWDDCVDLVASYVDTAADEFGLDEDGQECLGDGMREGDLLHDLLRSSFTDESPDENSEALQPFIELVQGCSVGADGDGGVLVDGMAESFAAGGTLSEEQAKCVAQAIFDDIGAAGMAEFGNASTAEDQERIESVLTDAAEKCDVDLADLGG